MCRENDKQSSPRKGAILMREAEYTEQDWQLFRSKLPQWQEAYMDKLNEGYVALLTADGNASDKFWALENRLRKDKQSAGVCVEMKRSKLIWNLMALLDEGVISQADLDGFSEGIQETLGYFFYENSR